MSQSGTNMAIMLITIGILFAFGCYKLIVATNSEENLNDYEQKLAYASVQLRVKEEMLNIGASQVMLIFDKSRQPILTEVPNTPTKTFRVKHWFKLKGDSREFVFTSMTKKDPKHEYYIPYDFKIHD